LGANLGLMWATLQVRGVLRDIDTIQHGEGGQGSGGYEGIVQGATYTKPEELLTIVSGFI